MKNWKAIFDGHNSWVATAIERTVGVWQVLIGDRDVGTAGSIEAARELVGRVNESSDGGGKS